MPAIFIGRFQPFHKGHQKAIKWILKREKKIIIVIGSIQESSTKDNPFSFQERKEMLNRTLLSAKVKNFEIYGVPDVLNDALWTKTILKILNLKKAVIFTKNYWTERCFLKAGMEVRRHPLFFNGLCATQVRENIINNKTWENMVPQGSLSFLKSIKGEEKIKFLGKEPEKRAADFIREKIKQAKAKGGIIGVSGGIDSSVVAVLLKKALKSKTVFLWLSFSKKEPIPKNITLLEKKLKTSIQKIYLEDAYKGFLKTFFKNTQSFDKNPFLNNKIPEGNLKSRLRMCALYYFANLHNLLVIGTTNKSEMELGYFTKYGDGGVDIEPVADLYKTEVTEMAKRLKLPEEIIEAVPTAGLWKDQTDEKELGLSYQKIDTVLRLSFQNFQEQDISFLTSIPKKKIKKILERREKNLHKLSIPSFCRFKF